MTILENTMTYVCGEHETMLTENKVFYYAILFSTFRSISSTVLLSLPPIDGQCYQKMIAGYYIFKHVASWLLQDCVEPLRLIN